MYNEEIRDDGTNGRINKCTNEGISEMDDFMNQHTSPSAAPPARRELYIYKFPVGDDGLDFMEMN